jgi:hypothetical protein
MPRELHFQGHKKEIPCVYCLLRCLPLVGNSYFVLPNAFTDIMKVYNIDFLYCNDLNKYITFSAKYFEPAQNGNKCGRDRHRIGGALRCDFLLAEKGSECKW